MEVFLLTSCQALSYPGVVSPNTNWTQTVYFELLFLLFVVCLPSYEFSSLSRASLLLCGLGGGVLEDQ